MFGVVLRRFENYAWLAGASDSGPRLLRERRDESRTAAGRLLVVKTANNQFQHWRGQVTKRHYRASRDLPGLGEGQPCFGKKVLVEVAESRRR